MLSVLEFYRLPPGASCEDVRRRREQLHLERLWAAEQEERDAEELDRELREKALDKPTSFV